MQCYTLSVINHATIDLYLKEVHTKANEEHRFARDAFGNLCALH